MGKLDLDHRVWCSLTCLVLFTRPLTILSKPGNDRQSGVLLCFIGLVWLHTLIRPIACPTATPPYDMFTIYLLFLGSSIPQICGLLQDCTVFSTSYPLSLHHSRPLSSNLVAVIGLLCLVLSRPLAAPNNLISPSEIVRKPFDSLDNS